MFFSGRLRRSFIFQVFLCSEGPENRVLGTKCLHHLHALGLPAEALFKKQRRLLSHKQRRLQRHQTHLELLSDGNASFLFLLQLQPACIKFGFVSHAFCRPSGHSSSLALTARATRPRDCAITSRLCLPIIWPLWRKLKMWILECSWGKYMAGRYMSCVTKLDRRLTCVTGTLAFIFFFREITTAITVAGSEKHRISILVLNYLFIVLFSVSSLCSHCF